MNKSILSQLSTLSDRTRVRLVRILTSEECSVNELMSILEIPQSTVSRHLKILMEHNWINRREYGNSNLYSCTIENLPVSHQSLWSILSAEEHSTYEKDDLRLQTILSLRRVDSAAFFEQHAAKWNDLRQELFGKRFLLPTLLSMLSSDLCIVDVGCGTGEALHALAPTEATLIGVDISPEMLSIARTGTMMYPNVVLRQGDVNQLPLKDNEADVLLCMLVLHHISDINKAFREMHRCLKPNGRLIVLDMRTHQHQEFVNMGHQHLGFSKEMFYSLDLFTVVNYQLLRKESHALGPDLFIATLHPL